MTMTLRPYQAEARDAILQEWDQGRKRTLLVLPTGCGKTVVFSKVAEDRVSRGGSWGNFTSDCSVASRNGYSPDFRGYNLGFRVVRNAP